MGTVVGPPLANSLIGDLSADMVAVQGVNYPADVAGAISGAADPKDSVGATTCSALVQQALSQCATTKVAIAGYSQGAEVVHGCLQNVQMGQVSVCRRHGNHGFAAEADHEHQAAVTFGDPLENTTFSNIDASKTKVYCAQGDAVCYGQFSISAAHLSYGSDGDTTTGAQFIVSALGATNSTTK